MENVSESAQNQTEQQQLVFSTAEHHAALQNHLFKQWSEGENCDLIISADSENIPVHSCVVACFSAKICHHLLEANLSTLAEGRKHDQYSLVEDGVCFTFCSSGEKRVAVDVGGDTIKALVGFMYTGSVSVPEHQIMSLLKAAQLLSVSIVINIIEVFVSRSPVAVETHSQASTHAQETCANGEQISGPPVEQVLHENRPPSIAHAETSDTAVDNNAEALLASLDSAELNVKQESEGDIKAFLILATDGQSEQEHKVCGGELSANAENGLVVSAASENVTSGGLPVKNEQEDDENFPLHFDKLISQSQSRNLHQSNKKDPQKDEESIEPFDGVPFTCGKNSRRKRTCTIQNKPERAKSNDKPFSCKYMYCKEVLCNKGSLKRHSSRKHKGKKPQGVQVHHTAVKPSYLCTQCSYQASSKHALSKHVVEEHAPFSCQECSQKFLKKANLTCHLRMVHSLKGLNAGRWTKLVARPNGKTTELSGRENSTGADFSEKVNEEMESSHGDTDASGPMCHDPDTQSLETSPSEHSVSGSQLRKRTNKSLRLRRCCLCMKDSVGPAAHFQHLREEHSDACFSCTLCSKSYVRKESLTNHVRSEHEGRVWKCYHCMQVFRKASKLLTHSKAQHGDEKPYRCEEPSCEYRTGRWKAMTNHKSNLHATERNSVCDKCGSRFTSQFYLRLHQRSCLKLDQHLCSVCGEVFCLRQSLLNHINNMHGGKRRISCDQCGRLFSCHSNRNRHMRIHDNTFPYKCDTCGQKFRHSNTLKDHVRSKHKHEK